MRCHVGDLAVVVGGQVPQNIGRYVTVLAPISGDAWECRAESRVTVFHARDLPVMYPAGYVGVVRDRNLRPIRPGPGIDETLRGAGVPKSAGVRA